MKEPMGVSGVVRSGLSFEVVSIGSLLLLLVVAIIGRVLEALRWCAGRGGLVGTEEGAESGVEVAEEGAEGGDAGDHEDDPHFNSVMILEACLE